MNRILFILIFLFAIVFVVVGGKDLKEKCLTDTDCQWIITNCCPESAGAYWECVNRKTYVPRLDCDKVFVVCPQVLSPKPTSKCVCQNGDCVVK